jgi:hypothetical protein
MTIDLKTLMDWQKHLEGEVDICNCDSWADEETPAAEHLVQKVDGIEICFLPQPEKQVILVLTVRTNDDGCEK